MLKLGIIYSYVVILNQFYNVCTVPEMFLLKITSVYTESIKLITYVKKYINIFHDMGKLIIIVQDKLYRSTGLLNTFVKSHYVWNLHRLCHFKFETLN